MADQSVVTLRRSMMGVTMFLLGCVLDAALGLAFTEFGANGGSVLGSGYIQVSPWYFYAVALVGVLTQLSVAIFGARKYRTGGNVTGGVIISAVFFLVPILYFLMFVFTEYLFTRQAVNLEFAEGITVILTVAFVWASAMTLLLQASIENSRYNARV